MTPFADESPIRKRLRRREAPGDVRFVTFSCQRRLPLLGDPATRDMFSRELAAARLSHGFQLFAWVVMPEHVHLLLRPADGATLGAALRSLKTAVAKRVVNQWREQDDRRIAQILTARGDARFWQKGGGFDRNVRDGQEFCREVRYTHRNPVERGLVAKPEDWAWSSVRWWMGQRDGVVECDPPPGDPQSWVSWKGYK